MGKGEMNQTDDFIDRVENVLGPFLRSQGYAVLAARVTSNELQTEVIYQRDYKKIAVYHSVPEGEVNCLIGGHNANEAHIEPPAWQYLNRVLLDAERITRDQLRLLAAAPPVSWQIQLNGLAPKIIDNFDAIEKVLATRF